MIGLEWVHAQNIYILAFGAAVSLPFVCLALWIPTLVLPIFQHMMGKKLDLESGWMAYLPVFNVLHWVNMAGWPWYSFLLLLFPGLNLILLLIILMQACHARGKTRLWALALPFPPATIFALPYLAFSRSEKSGILVWLLVMALTVGGPLGVTAYFLFHPETPQGQFLWHQKDRLPEMEDYFRNIFEAKKKELFEDEILVKEEEFIVYRDLKGNEHYVNAIEEVPPAFRDQATRLNSRALDAKFELLSSQDEAQLVNDLQGKPLPQFLANREWDIFIYTDPGNKDLPATKDYFDKYGLTYIVLDVLAQPEYAVQLKMKLGLDINKKYRLLLPVVEINGQMVQRIPIAKNREGEVVKTALNREKINSIFGMRSTFE